jgi:hypothetical protein
MKTRRAATEAETRFLIAETGQKGEQLERENLVEQLEQANPVEQLERQQPAASR